ncbi:MAG: hypothetical protein GX891_04285 [Clostridiales bacterium]|nr:hypothetical protein [Clostridiales bacterium]
MRLTDLTHFEVEGETLSRLVREITSNVFVCDLKIKGKKLCFSCKLNDEPKCVAILKELCYNYTIIRRSGLASFLRFLAKRLGIIAGIAVSFVITVLFNFFIADIDVGEEEYKAKAESILSDSGVKRGKFLFNIDYDALQLKLLELEGISYAKVERAGTKIVVTIKRELPPPDILPAPSGSVKCAKRAVFSRAIVFFGTLVPKKGDIVERGDVLIGNYIMVGEEKVPSQASGEVYGYCYYTATMTFYDYKAYEEKQLINTVLFAAVQDVPLDAEIVNFTHQAIYDDGKVTITVTVQTEERIDL